jgi:cytochrome c-type biogenesis protein CcmF
MAWASFLPFFGELCLSFALGLSLFSCFFGFAGGFKKNENFVRLSERSLYLAFILLTLSTLALVACFLMDNFLVRYVYAYSNREMPTVYKISALWGGQDGSLLFWLWLNSVFAALAVYFHRIRDRNLIPHVIGVFGFILGFFAILLLFKDNPFKLFPFAPPDGRGLNPLLQNPSMAIHPPSLYLGFVGMSVPFAFAFSALLSNQLDTRWIVATRVWTLIAWFFLSIGNVLGSQWAYVELGWGGFWGWDPVENAAIMPWFTASAFLHSVMIQEKRGMLKFWNMNLVVISFCLTILGTYLTRSGVVQSVHSFARSNIGYFFLGFLAVVIVASAILIYKRRNELRSDNIFESFLSKESAFVVNNIVLVGTAFIILWCTLFPTASELITGTRILVGPPFFNQMLAPLAIVLLVLTGIGPMIAWKKASKQNLKKSFTWPLIVGALCSLVIVLLGLTFWYVVLTAFGVGFVVCTIAMEFYAGARARVIQYKETWAQALPRAVFRNNRKYGGYIVHIGIVLIFIGIAGSAYKRVYEFDMAPGSVQSFEDYTIRFNDFKQIDQRNQIETFALIDLYVGDEFVDQVRPARFFYKAQEQPSTEVDIYSRWKEDVYFTLGSINPETRITKVHVSLNPFVAWLWIGGFILALGGLIAMMPPLRTRSS